MGAETWLDVIPALPLARGVPFLRITTTSNDSGRHVSFGLAEGPWSLKDIDDTATLHGLTVSTIRRIDLEDPQGLGWALRLLMLSGGCTESLRAWALRCFARMGSNHPADAITDADRLALARALREVFGG